MYHKEEKGLVLMKKKIEINTERLQLKPLGLVYLKTVNEYALDIENTKYMCHLPNSNEQETADFLTRADMEWEKEKPDFYEFAILYNDRQIGAVSISLEENTGELGWIIHKKYWRKGIAFEAAAAVVKYFFEVMGINHFIASCDSANIASYKVMEKLGMVKTGECYGRKNRSSVQESMEYHYELMMNKN